MERTRITSILDFIAAKYITFPLILLGIVFVVIPQAFYFFIILLEKKEILFSCIPVGVIIIAALLVIKIFNFMVKIKIVYSSEKGIFVGGTCIPWPHIKNISRPSLLLYPQLVSIKYDRSEKEITTLTLLFYFTLKKKLHDLVTMWKEHSAQNKN